MRCHSRSLTAHEWCTSVSDSLWSRPSQALSVYRRSFGLTLMSPFWLSPSLSGYFLRELIEGFSLRCCLCSWSFWTGGFIQDAPSFGRKPSCSLPPPPSGASAFLGTFSLCPLGGGFFPQHPFWLLALHDFRLPTWNPTLPRSWSKPSATVEYLRYFQPK